MKANNLRRLGNIQPNEQSSGTFLVQDADAGANEVKVINYGLGINGMYSREEAMNMTDGHTCIWMNRCDGHVEKNRRHNS